MPLLSEGCRVSLHTIRKSALGLVPFRESNPVRPNLRKGSALETGGGLAPVDISYTASTGTVEPLGGIEPTNLPLTRRVLLQKAKAANIQYFRFRI